MDRPHQRKEPRQTSGTLESYGQWAGLLTLQRPRDHCSGRAHFAAHAPHQPLERPHLHRGLLSLCLQSHPGTGSCMCECVCVCLREHIHERALHVLVCLCARSLPLFSIAVFDLGGNGLLRYTACGFESAKTRVQRKDWEQCTG